MSYQNKLDLMNALSKAAKGQERSSLLSDSQNRNLVLNSGASLFMISGAIQNGNNYQEQFQNIKIGVIERLNAHTGQRDGIGGLGGLSERTSEEDFNNMSLEERKSKIGKQDDIIADKDGNPILIKDINIIRINTVDREMEEELDNIGIKNFCINLKKIELVPMDGIRDDNFITNIWDGKSNFNQIYAINPYCHKLRVEEKFLDSIIAKSQNPQDGSEVKGFIKLPLFEALGRFGKIGGEITTKEDNRDLEHDYRYPHEYLVSWVEASSLLKHNPEKMIDLVSEVQGSIKHPLNFEMVAKKINKDLFFIDNILQLPNGTTYLMQEKANTVYNNKKETKLWIQKAQKKVR